MIPVPHSWALTDRHHPHYSHPLGPQHEQGDASPFHFLKATTVLWLPAPTQASPPKPLSESCGTCPYPHYADHCRVSSELPITCRIRGCQRHHLMTLLPQALLSSQHAPLSFGHAVPSLCNTLPGRLQSPGLFQPLYPSCCAARGSHTLTPKRTDPGGQGPIC